MQPTRSPQPFRESLAGDPIRWALVADDLTGAADSAVAFALAGFETVLALDPTALASDRGELLAVSTDTRDEGPRESVRRVTDCCRKLVAAGRQLVFKKVDSLLRGNIAEETEAALDACGFATALLCPALPREGRAVASGRLHTRPDDAGRYLPRSRRLATPDAATDADLARLAEQLLDVEPPALPAGSAGLSFPWARTLASLRGRSAAPPLAPRTDLPVALVVGSVHQRTIRQLDGLRERRNVGCIALEDLATHSWDDRDLVVRIPISNADPSDLAPLTSKLSNGECGGLLLSGGATAGWVLDALDACSIELHGEAIAGCPWGTVHGGTADQVTVVTKSGAFGPADTLVHIADFLRGRRGEQ